MRCPRGPGGQWARDSGRRKLGGFPSGKIKSWARDSEETNSRNKCLSDAVPGPPSCRPTEEKKLWTYNTVARHLRPTTSTHAAQHHSEDAEVGLVHSPSCPTLTFDAVLCGVREIHAPSIPGSLIIDSCSSVPLHRRPRGTPSIEGPPRTSLRWTALFPQTLVVSTHAKLRNRKGIKRKENEISSFHPSQWFEPPPLPPSP